MQRELRCLPAARIGWVEQVALVALGEEPKMPPAFLDDGVGGFHLRVKASISAMVPPGIWARWPKWAAQCRGVLPVLSFTTASPGAVTWGT